MTPPIAPPITPPVADAVVRSADRLARGMVTDLGLDAGLAARVEVERFVAACATWAVGQATAPARPPHALADRALRVLARWGEGQSAEAAAWQLALSALAIADGGFAPRRAAG